ncbi:hypothetical protein ACHAXA_010064 [Cyclostephanos tholiformis]|uniref:Methyltransferase type 11 domain-containing protein n=1 Tax=Cyclostephanos tholiformis TaxID=382380 RepID=A0ABD3SFM4_9STRA
MAQQYGEVVYWNDRYSNEKEPFEWYVGYDGIKHFLTAKYLMSSVDAKNQSPNKVIKGPFQSTKDCRVLIAGCGNSQVGESLLCDGFGKITNVDFSSIVIEQMRKLYSDEWYSELHTRLRSEQKLDEVETNPTQIATKKNVRSPTKKDEIPTFEKMHFECTDLTNEMNFRDESFDMIFCKGALDAVLCGTNASKRVQCMLNECHRILDSKHGVMVIISYGEPNSRLNLFEKNQWEVKIKTVPKPYVPGEKMGG